MNKKASFPIALYNKLLKVDKFTKRLTIKVPICSREIKRVRRSVYHHAKI